jgi:riboflavin synthase
MGTVTRFAEVGESWELRLLAPGELGKYLAYKGSITVNGVSLTVNRVTDTPRAANQHQPDSPHRGKHGAGRCSMGRRSTWKST